MRIAERQIGQETPPYVIAEIGVNHDGSLERALEMVDGAAEAGADAVKVQMFEADLLMSRASRLAEYQRAAGEREPIEMLRRLQLEDRALDAIARQAEARGMAAIVTVFSVELVGRAAAMPFDAFKTASPDIIHRPLLEALAAVGRPMIVSTGASTVAEVTRATEWLARFPIEVSLLQCVSCYPTREEDAAFEGIGALMAEFATHHVGYSDHLASECSGAQAVIMGACILEKHFTHDTGAAGPDHAASLDLPGLARYVRVARAAWQACRSGPEARARGFLEATGLDWQSVQPRGSVNAPWRKEVLPCEEDVRRLSRQSIVARRDLAAGERLRAEDLTMKRPGTGLAPWQVDGILGKVLSRNVEADTPITSDHLIL
ncbi:MAG: N-acetylneuraminate synthase family protein [Phycisphaerales bacterium]